MINRTPLEFQKDCETIVRETGRLLSSYENKFKVVQLKDAIDVATTADIEAEKLAISYIQSKYPNHRIHSEEAGDLKGESEFVWYIDPLDGTKEYVRGVREYNSIVAVEEKDSLIAGAIMRNGINELYACSKGNGSYKNGVPVHVSHTNDMSTAFVGMHFPINSSVKDCVEKSLHIAEHLIYKSYRIRPGWDEAKLLGYVAQGTIDAHVMPSCIKNAWHDIASGLLLVMEAGGKVTDWNGNTIKNHDLSHGILASNGMLHKELLELINR